MKYGLLKSLMFVLLLSTSALAQENIQQQVQQANKGKFQALYLGEDKSGFHIVLMVNTETGTIEKRIFYDELNDHQDIYNFATKEIITITRQEEKKYETK